MRPRRRERRRDHHSNHFQRLHEHSTRGAERADPGECACGGRGWILSSCDVWEKCSKHYSGQAHPESLTPEQEKRYSQIYHEKCREERIDDPAQAHREALEEKQRREEESGDRPWWIGGSDDPDETGDEDPELPF